MKLHNLLSHKYVFLFYGLILGSMSAWILMYLSNELCSVDFDYFKVPFPNILDYIFTLSIAIFVTYYLSNKLNRFGRYFQIHYERLVELENDIKELDKLINDCISNRCSYKDVKSKILSLFTESFTSIQMLKESSSSKNILYIEKLDYAYDKLSSVWEISTKNELSLSSNEEVSIQANLRLLKPSIHKCKIALHLK